MVTSSKSRALAELLSKDTLDDALEDADYIDISDHDEENEKKTL
jgi:hypothetical protein